MTEHNVDAAFHIKFYFYYKWRPDIFTSNHSICFLKHRTHSSGAVGYIPLQFHKAAHISVDNYKVFRIISTLLLPFNFKVEVCTCVCMFVWVCCRTRRSRSVKWLTTGLTRVWFLAGTEIFSLPSNPAQVGAHPTSYQGSRECFLRQKPAGA